MQLWLAVVVALEIEVINNDITLYFPNSFDIERKYKENKMFGELKIVNYNIVSKSDIVLSFVSSEVIIHKGIYQFSSIFLFLLILSSNAFIYSI